MLVTCCGVFLFFLAFDVFLWWATVVPRIALIYIPLFYHVLYLLNVP